MKFLTNSGNFYHFPNSSGTFSQNLETVCHSLNIIPANVHQFFFRKIAHFIEKRE